MNIPGFSAERALVPSQYFHRATETRPGTGERSSGIRPALFVTPGWEACMALCPPGTEAFCMDVCSVFAGSDPGTFGTGGGTGTGYKPPCPTRIKCAVSCFQHYPPGAQRNACYLKCESGPC